MADGNVDRVEQLLEEAVLWLRALAVPQVRESLAATLKTSEERRVYQASTGGSMQEVAAAAGVSHQTVSNYWRRWTGTGERIVVPTEVKGRYRRLYDLAVINLPVEVERDGNA